MVALASGADPTNVTVSDLQGRTFPGGENGSSAFGNEYAKAKRYHEHEWRRKIEAVLTHVQGAVVGIDVTLNKVQSEISIAHNVSQAQPVHQENNSTKSYVNSPSRGGQPGAESNGVTQANLPTSVASGGGRESEETTQFDVTKSAVSTEDIQKREIGLTPDFVSASILVPKSYIRRIWDDSNPPKPDADPADPQVPTAAELKQIEDAETEKIRRLVDRLLPPIDDGSDKWPRIEVSTYVDLPTTEADTLSSSTAAMGWLAGNWQMLATFFIGIMALMMVRSALKPAGSVDGSAESGEEGDEGSRLAVDESSDDDVNMLRLRRGDDGPSLKEELTDLVRDDPDAAASVLSQWIVNSS